MSGAATKEDQGTLEALGSHEVMDLLQAVAAEVEPLLLLSVPEAAIARKLDS